MDNNKGGTCVYEAGTVTCQEGLCFRCCIPERQEMLHLLQRALFQARYEDGAFDEPGPLTPISKAEEIE